MTPVRSFLNGFKAPFRGAFLIVRSPSLLSLVAIPLLINLCIYIVFFWYLEGTLSHFIQNLMTQFPPWVPHWAASVSYFFLRAMLWLTLLFVSVISFTVVGGILASPFNDILSARTAQIRLKTGEASIKAVNRSTVAVPVLTSIWLESKRSLILVLAGVSVVIVGLIPFMQIPALMGGAWALAFEYLGYPISRRSTALTTIVAFILKRPFVSLGFGMALLFLMAMPFLGIIYIPLAVVGATMIDQDY